MSNLTYREKYQRMLIRDEGLVLKAYRCPAGYWTAGAGRNLDALGIKGCRLWYYRTIGITREKAMQWLDEDVAVAEKDCHAIFGRELFESWSENRRLGWVNFLFNLGRSRALKFVNTIRHAKEGRWDVVGHHLQLSLWFRQVKSRADRVIRMIVREEFPYA